MNIDIKINGLWLIFWTTLIIAGNVFFWKKDGLADAWKITLRTFAPFTLVIFPPGFTYFFLIGPLSILWTVIAAVIAALFGLNQNDLTMLGFHPIEWLCGLVCLPAFYKLFTWLGLARYWHWMLLLSFMFVAGYRDVRTLDLTPEGIGPYIRKDFVFTDALAPLLAFVLCCLMDHNLVRKKECTAGKP